MDLNQVFGTDKTLEEEGVWIDMSDTSSIKIARLNNPAFKQQASKLSKKNKIVDNFSNVRDESLIKLVSETILLDWKEIKDDGKTIPYSKENAFNLLKKYNDFVDYVVEQANDIENFRKKEIEEDKDILKKS